MWKTVVLCVALGLAVLISVQGLANQDVLEKEAEKKESLSFPESWQGVWKGKCRAYYPNNRKQEFAMELHILPTKTADRMTWRIVYGEGAVKQTREYELIIKDRAKGLYQVDEKNSIVLDSVYMGGSLNSQYSVNNSMLTVTYTLREGALCFDLMSSKLDKKIKTGGEGGIPEVFGYPVDAVQRACLKKQMK